ncbi:hypothetical protein DFO70_10314 [Cytobacillus firmus]|uniref:Uncharacterized protein n=2 Tax=Cytobacillus TaxID=2675230 RepID=A0A366JZP8_CYTFI|nr:hypothetical protein DFO70_10314 [Cytobacillus firmus]TDX43827.1 hypothetical protein DFO72_10427 [Cytobacillus oceanisediminis]
MNFVPLGLKRTIVGRFHQHLLLVIILISYSTKAPFSLSENLHNVLCSNIQKRHLLTKEKRLFVEYPLNGTMHKKRSYSVNVIFSHINKLIPIININYVKGNQDRLTEFHQNSLTLNRNPSSF